MPRRPRGLKDHCCYHVTHRCHRREFLFKFARDRQVYVDLLRETEDWKGMKRIKKLKIVNGAHTPEWTFEYDEDSGKVAKIKLPPVQEDKTSTTENLYDTELKSWGTEVRGLTA